MYRGALSATEIQQIYSAGQAGKCAVQSPPLIIAQPKEQSAVIGTEITFCVVAAGRNPLNYQWNFNGVALRGATGPNLILSKLQFGNAGTYTVLVSNLQGSVLSSNAGLTMKFPPAVLQAGSPAGSAAERVVLPINLVANGNENAVSFSLNFPPALLHLEEVQLGSDASLATLLVNTSEAATGRVGIAFSLPADTAFGIGKKQVAQLLFTAALVTSPQTAEISFGDRPMRRQLSDPQAQVLDLTYEPGRIAISPAEVAGDVSPRPNGDQAVSVTDWVLLGRYVARLDYPTNAAEMRRADCAPRLTSGDGVLTVSDWVQAGRYLAGLDPFTLVHPVAETTLPLSRSVRPQTMTPTVQLKVGDLLLGAEGSGAVSIVLEALGGENAAAISLAFDPVALTFTGAALGRDSTGSTLNINATHSSAGQLGLVLALPPGRSFTAGTKELIKTSFRASPSASGAFPLALTDNPVPREIVNADATPVSVRYLDGVVSVNVAPRLEIARAAGRVILSWPLWATQSVLQELGQSLESPGGWSNVLEAPSVWETQNTLSVPSVQGHRFYRLYRP